MIRYGGGAGKGDVEKINSERPWRFWRTATARTLNNREIELNATVDGQYKTITEASVRRHLKFVDADGISTLPTTEVFEQLALMWKTRTKTKRMGIRIPLSSVSSSVADEAITKEMHDGLGKATTTASSLEAEQGSGNTSRSGAGSMQLLELIDICTKLSNKVTALENELKSTKAIYNKALITLTKIIMKLEKKLKHKRKRAVVDSLDDEEASLDNEDSPKQEKMIEEIDEDENVNLVKSSKQGEAHETARHRMEVVDFSTASPQKDNDEITPVETFMSKKRVQQKIKVSDEARIAQENLAQAEQWDDVQA
nr:hypothetical protein [Tanacetum cinerariifolium]